jgi:hypothetical protein
MHKRLAVTLTLTLALLGLTHAAAAQDAAIVELSSDAIAVRPVIEADGVRVSVSTPNGTVLTRSFGRNETIVLPLVGTDGVLLGDGAYTYELRFARRLDAAAQARLSAQRVAEDSGAAPFARLPEIVQSGSFRVQGGAVVTGGSEAQRAVLAGGARRPATPDTPGPSPDDQVIPDDLIVQGSVCAGFDCVNNESFGFDTIRLKENNTRIKFDDTSAAGFPANDWQLTANESAGGGLNKFSIEDITGAKVPFTVVAGAATNSIFVDSTGRLGLRTSTPVLDVHVNTSNTPAMRLEQNNSGGFTAQTWDIAGNEANFFVRDVTAGSRLPFRIRPGAPTSSIDINASGNVGVGTASPTASLHVLRSDATAKVIVQETSGTTAARNMVNIINNGASTFRFDNTAVGNNWGFGSTGANAFFITNSTSGVLNMSLTTTGNMTISGTLTQNSDRTTKDGIAEVDGHDVLAKVSALPISTWHYKSDDADVRHLGPMAQDFAAAFGLGQDDRHIAPVDMGGVALAAIKALHEVVQAKDAQLDALQKQNAELAARLAAIESTLAQR